MNIKELSIRPKPSWSLISGKVVVALLNIFNVEHPGSDPIHDQIYHFTHSTSRGEPLSPRGDLLLLSHENSRPRRPPRLLSEVKARWNRAENVSHFGLACCSTPQHPQRRASRIFITDTITKLAQYTIKSITPPTQLLEVNFSLHVGILWDPVFPRKFAPSERPRDSVILSVSPRCGPPDNRESPRRLRVYALLKIARRVIRRRRARRARMPFRCSQRRIKYITARDTPEGERAFFRTSGTHTAPTSV